MPPCSYPHAINCVPVPRSARPKRLRSQRPLTPTPPPSYTLFDPTAMVAARGPPPQAEAPQPRAITRDRLLPRARGVSSRAGCRTIAWTPCSRGSVALEQRSTTWLARHPAGGGQMQRQAEREFTADRRSRTWPLRVDAGKQGGRHPGRDWEAKHGEAGAPWKRSTGGGSTGRPARPRLDAATKSMRTSPLLHLTRTESRSRSAGPARG